MATTGGGCRGPLNMGVSDISFFFKKRLTFLSQRDFPDIGLGGGRWTLSKARCMQSAQEVLSVVRRGTRWSFRVTWSFSRWDVDAVARQHALAYSMVLCNPHPWSPCTKSRKKEFQKSSSLGFEPTTTVKSQLNCEHTVSVSLT